MAEEREDQAFEQTLFMRKVRFGEDDVMSPWPRRVGKTHTLRKLVKPMFKRRGIRVQVLNAHKGVITVKMDTQVLIVDEASTPLFEYIKKNRPELRLVGLYTPLSNTEAAKTAELAKKSITFEK